MHVQSCTACTILLKHILFFGLSLSTDCAFVLIFGLFGSTVCAPVLIFGLFVSTDCAAAHFLGLFVLILACEFSCKGLITKLRCCRELEYYQIYAFFVLIFWSGKNACAIFHAFCMSVLLPIG